MVKFNNIIFFIMEAFILEERVITAQHMSRADHPGLKYLRRYDLPIKAGNSCVTLKKSKQRKERKMNRSVPINFHKVKNLLSTLTLSYQTQKSQSHIIKNDKIDKYFFSLSDSSKAINDAKRSNTPLLIRKINPMKNQYDSNFDMICHRAPCWTFNPHDRLIGRKIKTDDSDTRNKTNADLRVQTADKWMKMQKDSRSYRINQSEQYVLEKIQQKIFEQMRERSGIGEYSQDCKIQYSPAQLARCASEIFKKYQLDKNVYFKKFLGDIQQL